MKITNFLLIGFFMIMLCCSKKVAEYSKDKLVGTWVEKNPEMFDGISDTLVFTDDLTVKKHFYFNGWKYTISNDTITFKKENVTKSFSFLCITGNEIVFYNFIDRSITSQVKDIYFTKIN